MKMNFKTLMMAAFAMTVGFSSCSSDDENTIGGDEKTLFIKISNGPSSYAEGSAVVDGSVVTFTSGYLYFVNNAGSIVERRTIGTGASFDIDLGGSITSTGETLTGVHPAAHSVVVVGNNIAVTSISSGLITAVRKAVISVNNQSSLANINLYGEKVMTPPTGSATAHTVVVDLASTVARIELSDITYTGNVITAFDVTGIFVDNFEESANTDGSIIPDVSAILTNPAEYVGTSTKYAAFISMFDYNTSGLGGAATDLVKAPASGVWAYNVLQSTNVPRIIIRLENIVATGLTYTGPQFLTITGFEASTGPVTAFEGGKVYKIGAGVLKFDEDDLTPNPNMTEIDVEITIENAKWKVVDVTPVL